MKGTDGRGFGRGIVNTVMHVHCTPKDTVSTCTCTFAGCG